ncbi:hypothetical protein [Actinoallomurus sp. CA-142502]
MGALAVVGSIHDLPAEPDPDVTATVLHAAGELSRRGLYHPPGG